MNQVNSNDSSLGISSRLLLDMKMSAPISGDSEMVAIEDPNGNVQILALSNKGNLFNIKKSSDEAGWEQIQLTIPFLVSTFNMGSSTDQVIAFATGENESSPEIFCSLQASDGTWGNWDVISNTNNIPQNTNVISLVPISVGGDLHLYAFLQGSSGSSQAGELSLWWIPWDSATAAWVQLGNPSGTLSAHGNIKDVGEGLLAFERSSDPTKFDLRLFPVPSQGQPQIIVNQTAARCLTSDIQSNGYSAIFYNEYSWMNGNDTLYFVDGSKEVGTPVKLPLEANTGITQLVATSSGLRDPLTLFLLDADKHLFVLRQPAPGDSWREPFELGDTFSFITQANNQKGVIEIFGFDLNDTLRRFWESDDGEDLSHWKEESITIPADKLGQYSSYCTRMLVKDTQGNRILASDVTLYCAEITVATIGGKSVVLGPNKGVQVKTDYSGYLTIYSISESLSAAKLRVVIEEVMDTHVSRDTHSKTTLAGATEDEIKDLLPEKYQEDAPQVHQAVQKVMSAVDGQPSDHTSFYDKIDMSLLAEDFDFRFDVKKGRAIFTPLTPVESLELINSYSEAIKPMSWISFWNWLGDIVESAAHAIESAFTYVVKKVAEGVHVVVDVLIRGVKYVFSGIIKLVEEAFGVVTAIFSSVMVFFNSLFKFVGWLVTDAGKDIWATKAVISKSIQDVIPQIQNLISTGKDKVGTFVDGMEAKFDNAWDPLIASLGNTTFNYNNSGSDFFNANGVSQTPSNQEIAEENSSIANWFFDKLSGPHGGVTFIPQVAQKILTDAIDLVKTLGEIASESFKQQLNQFLTYLQDVVKNPQNFISLTVKEFLLEIKSIIHLVLRMLKAISQGLMTIANDAFDVLLNGVLNQPISLGFIGKIYNLINPGEEETPTLLDLFSLLAAIPTTVLFRIAEGHAPFTQSDVEAMMKSELSPAEHFRQFGLSKDNPLADTGATVMYKISCWMIIPYMFYELGGDIASWFVNKEGGNPPPVDLGTEIVNLLGGIVWPLGMLALAPAPWTWDTGENIWINITWIAWLVPSVLNIIWWLGSNFKDLATSTVLGTILYSISGFILLIVGIVTLVEEDNRNVAKGWLNIALPLPTMGKFLTYIPHPAAAVVLGVTDAACYLGSAISGLYLASNPEEGEHGLDPITVIG